MIFYNFYSDLGATFKQTRYRNYNYKMINVDVIFIKLDAVYVSSIGTRNLTQEKRKWKKKLKKYCCHEVT